MVKQKNQEAAVLLDQSQEVILAGNQYAMRRLNTRDVFRFSKLLANAMKHLATEGNSELNEQTFGLVLMAGLANEETGIADFYASLIGMTASEFLAQTPEFFADFLEVLPAQHDLQAFFGAVLKATRSLGSLWQGQ